MRVIATAPEHAAVRSISTTITRAANIELLGLGVCSLVVVLGFCLAVWGRMVQLEEEAGRSSTALVNLQKLRSPNEVLPLLTMFAEPFERQRVALEIYRRVVAASPLDHVGALAGVAIPASEVQADRRFVELRARLERRPALARVPVLTAADIADLKPNVVVRTRAEFRAVMVRALAWFLMPFWIAHGLRRWRHANDDPLLLPTLMMLTGIGMMSMVALRDPLRDSLTASAFAAGVAAGVGLLVAASEIDFEASRLRRAMLAPLSAALALALLLLVFGSGPGSSGVKVNLFGFQPVEAIRLLVVFALAAYFAARLEFLRELSEVPTPARPWLRYVQVPRWKDVRPVAVSMSLVLLFFFLQKDLGPALVLACVFMALYGLARGRAAFVLVGFAMLLAGFSGAYWIGYPSTVRQRVAIWLDPWNNGVTGGNQIAHGLWALSTGALWGSGPGSGSPHSIPAGHTDFVLAAAGEELGFLGLIVIVALYAILSWRCLRVAARAPGDYSTFLSAGVALALVVQAFVIASGLLGLFPLSGVVTPFLSYGRSSMIANFFAVGVVMAVARRRGLARPHFNAPLRALGAVLAIATLAVVGRAAWIQVVKADEIATAASLSEQADGGYRFEYNPRLVAASRLVPRGTIYDRNGLPLATSRADEIRAVSDSYLKAGIALDRSCSGLSTRCYPLGGVAFSVLGDWDRQTNWGARNSSYIERDRDDRLRGYDDRQRVIDVTNPRTGVHDRTIRRDYRDLLPLVRHRYDLTNQAVQSLLTRRHDVRSTIDARLQVRTASALRTVIGRGGHARGAAIVLDVDTGDVLASASYPWPLADDDDPETLLDRARYGLYPPGSTFKLLVAAAALRTTSGDNQKFACIRLPDGRVGNFVRGWSRPVRDDPLDTFPHGELDLRRALVVSCNAYFAQLALRLGSRPILDAASFFQIDAASPATAGSLNRTLPQAGYGQGEVVVSPLKMARVAAAIAARGAVTPARWTVTPQPGAPSRERFLSESDAAELARFMREAVTSGTGRSLASNPVPIAGKTGTAEIAGGRAHSWFAGFAPFGGPHKIAFAVIVENAGYGARAALPVAGEIVRAAQQIGLFRQEP